MTSELKKAFENYIDIVEKNVVKMTIEDKQRGIFHLHKNESIELKTLVEEVEKTSAFQDLLNKTQLTFSDISRNLMDLISQDFSDISEESYLDEDEYIYLLWEIAVSNFFKRSGCYYNFYNKKKIDHNRLFESYCNAFKINDIEVEYLVPLEYVEFSKPSMDFGSFKIQKFTEDELEDIFHNSLNKTFYPFAAINIGKIEKYWFICVKEFISVKEKIRQIYDNETIPKELIKYPEKVRYALEIIALYKWEGEEHLLSKLVEEEAEKSGITSITEELKKMQNEKKKTRIESLEPRFKGFTIPFILKIDNNLITFPQRSPNPSTPEFYNKNIEKMLPGELHYFYNILNEDKTKDFESYIKLISIMVNDVRNAGEKGEFLNSALSYLSKALLSEGLEQLLWHIAALESLFGDKDDIINKLARRVSLILGNTEARKENLRKQIKEIYDFRSDMVHGSKIKKEITKEHLSLARHLTRHTLIWFLHCLNHLKGSVSDLPDRNTILLLIDLKEKTEYSTIEKLLFNLPQGFPNIEKWSK